jgi:hypothetical protein
MACVGLARFQRGFLQFQEVDRFLNFASVRTRYACFGTRISSQITSAVIGNLKKIGNLKYQSQIKGAQDRIFQTIWFFFGPGTTFDRSGLDFQILGLFQRQVQNREW